MAPLYDFDQIVHSETVHMLSLQDLAKLAGKSIELKQELIRVSTAIINSQSKEIFRKRAKMLIDLSTSMTTQ